MLCVYGIQHVHAAARAYFPTIGSVRGAQSINVTTLLYHYVRYVPSDDVLGASLSVTPNVFTEQLQYLLAHGYSPITPDTLYEALKGNDCLPDKPVLLTFDDATADFASTVYPIIQAYGVPVTVFVVPGFVGTKGYISWNQLRTIGRSHLVTIGGHGLNHVSLTRLNRDVAERQIIITKNILAAMSGQRITSFAYPNGSFNGAITKMVVDAGYATGFTADDDTAVSYDTRMTLPRIRAGQSVTTLERALNM